MQDITLKPSQGGQLMTGTSADTAGAVNWTIKRDFRRSIDVERRSEGYDLFAPNPANIKMPFSTTPSAYWQGGQMRWQWSGQNPYAWLVTSRPKNSGDNWDFEGEIDGNLRTDPAIIPEAGGGMEFRVEGISETNAVIIAASNTIQMPEIGETPTPTSPPPTADAITLVAMARQPNGRVAVVVGTKTTLFRYFGLENGLYTDPTYCDANYFDTNQGVWIQIGSGFSRKGGRWEALSINGYLVLNNGFDLPVTYRVEEMEVKPIYELREMGVASVRTIADHDGILHCGGVRLIQDVTLKQVLYPIRLLSNFAQANGSSTIAINFNNDILEACRQSAKTRANSELATANAALVAAQAVYDTADAALNVAQTALSAVQSEDDSSLAIAISNAQQALSEDPNNEVLKAAIASAQQSASQSDLVSAQAAVNQAKANLTEAKADLVSAKAAVSSAQSAYNDANANSDPLGIADWIAADPTRLIGMRLIWDSGDVRTIVGLTGPTNAPDTLVVDAPPIFTITAGAISGSTTKGVPSGPVSLENPKSYAAFSDESKIDSVQYRVVWSMASEPRRFGSSIPVTLDATKDYFQMAYPAKSIASGEDLVIAEAGSDGGNLPFTAALVNGSTIVCFDRAVTAVQSKADQAFQDANTAQLEAQASVTSCEHALESAKADLLTAKENLNSSIASHSTLKSALDLAKAVVTTATNALSVAQENYDAAQKQLAIDNGLLAGNPSNVTYQNNVAADNASVSYSLTALTSAQAQLEVAQQSYQTAKAALPDYPALASAVASATLAVEAASVALTNANARLTTTNATIAKLKQMVLPATSFMKRADAVDSITGKYDDLQGDGSGILKMAKILKYLAIYTETEIFIGTFTGNSEQPYIFDKLDIPPGTALYYPHTLFSVPGGGIYGSGAFHVYAGRNGFYKFDVFNKIPQEIPSLQDCRDLFFEQATTAPILGEELVETGATFDADGHYSVGVQLGWTYELTDSTGAVTLYDATSNVLTLNGTALSAVGWSVRPVIELSASNRIFAADNSITKEVFICFPSSTPDAAIRFDYRTGTVSTTSAMFTAAAMVVRPESKISVGKSEDWFVMGDESGLVLRYGLVSDKVINPGGARISKTAGSSVVTATAPVFTARMVGRSIITASRKVFAITGYTSATQVTVLGSAAAISAESFVIDPAIWHRNGASYESVIQSGLEAFGRVSNAKTFSRYVLMLSSRTPSSPATVVFMGSQNPIDAADLFSKTISQPDVHNLVTLIAKKYFFADRITVDGVNNPIEIVARVFSVQGADSRSFERR